MDEEKKSTAINIPKSKNDSNRSRRSKDTKTKSSFELSKMRCRMEELTVEEFPRRRSRSAPLSFEATSVAKELREAGELFQNTYQDKKKLKMRRRTVGANMDKRLSWPAWDSRIAEENENENVFNHSSSLPDSGTCV